ncbi:MAG: HAD family hydrolase [Gammaproteobacteria bacterium]|nr:HAD family hydrolase [Gammaproteobacteria bacterium]
MVKLISLDLDDTLWDAPTVLERAEQAQYTWLSAHCPDICAAYDMATLYALRMDYIAANPALAHSFTVTRQRFLAELMVRHGYDPALADDLMAHFMRWRSRVTLFPDVEPALARLRPRCKIAAVTNGNTDLELAGLAHHFDYYINPDRAGFAKPHPGIFNHLMALAEVSAHEVVHVGDHPVYDIQAARNAGVTAVWMNRTSSGWHGAQQRPDYEISDLEQLAELIYQQFLKE